MAATQTHEEIHADHRLWENEIRMWREDTSAWQQEQNALLAELERALGGHGRLMEKHAEQIGVHEGDIGRHEHFIAECEKTAREAGTVEESLSESHIQEEARHMGQRSTHERIKKHHHQVMARMRLVIDALNKAF
jgi:hypothetical protein